MELKITIPPSLDMMVWLLPWWLSTSNVFPPSLRSSSEMLHWKLYLVYPPISLVLCMSSIVGYFTFALLAVDLNGFLMTKQRSTSSDSLDSTPPLVSPLFTGGDIKLKKIGCFWTAAGDNQHADIFGTFLWIADVPSSGNSPHHFGVGHDGKTLVGGGLLCLLKTQDTAYYFDISNLYRSAFGKSHHSFSEPLLANTNPLTSGFLITYTGSAVGTSPGRLIETDANFNIIHRWPEDVAGNPETAALDISDLTNVKRLNNPDEIQPTIGPHYIKVNPDQKYIVVTDYFAKPEILN
ncbi:hypothetical protein BDZ45DRAFT_747040 [Acephala macrosclerotiorum]|nr:hypothetical protein BDZ45DRAFT_747040 [Acephala macrosclerotiorum]